MALDPSIVTGIRPVQIDSPVNALTQVLQAQNAQQQNQMSQAKLDEYQRSKARQNKLLDLVQSLPAGTTDDQRIDALKGGGYFDEADKLQTGMLNRRKVEAEAQSKEWDAQSKKLDMAGQAFNLVRQNPTLESANQVLDYLGQNGVYSPQTVAQYKAAVAADPSKIGSLAETAFRTVLSAKDQLMSVNTRNLGGTTQTLGVDPVTGKATVLSSAANTQSPDNAATNATSIKTTSMNNATSRANNAATVAATTRGQDMTDARAKDQIAAGRVPSGYRQGPDGTLVAIPGGPADQTGKAPTEFQGKSAAFGARAEQADKILTELQGKYSPTAINAKDSLSNTWGVGGALGAGANALLTASGQRAEQAQRDFVNAVLRQESGAAISPSEFDNARKQYFPQPGDGDAVIAQKAANRKLAIQGFKNNAGHAAFSAPAAGEHPAEIQSLLQKYGGK